MKSDYKYLLSGITASNTGYLFCRGTDNFSIGIIGASNGSNVATGTVTLSCRLQESSSYIPLQTINFTNNSGSLYQLKTPIESLRAILSSPATGTFEVLATYSWAKD